MVFDSDLKLFSDIKMVKTISIILYDSFFFDLSFILNVIMASS